MTKLEEVRRRMKQKLEYARLLLHEILELEKIEEWLMEQGGVEKAKEPEEGIIDNLPY